MSHQTKYMTRAEFIGAGFSFEKRNDYYILISNQKFDDGHPDYQGFKMAGELVIWLAAGFDEINREADRQRMMNNAA